MIRYALKCADDHGFESWFQSADAFDALNESGMVTCPGCGSAQISKAVMAPRVRPARSQAAPLLPVPGTEVTTQPSPADSAPSAEAKRPDRPLSAPASQTEAKLAQLRKHVEKNSDYVGLGFAAEARKMHDGETPLRSIYGEARLEEAKKLLEDGVPVAPLPFIPVRKTN